MYMCDANPSCNIAIWPLLPVNEHNVVLRLMLTAIHMLDSARKFRIRTFGISHEGMLAGFAFGILDVHRQKYEFAPLVAVRLEP